MFLYTRMSCSIYPYAGWCNDAMYYYRLKLVRYRPHSNKTASHYKTTAKTTEMSPIYLIVSTFVLCHIIEFIYLDFEWKENMLTHSLALKLQWMVKSIGKALQYLFSFEQKSLFSRLSWWKWKFILLFVGFFCSQ